ncbi:hypothetical protein LINGRAHAP2_LOCUS24233 [Linum grandiflorum]
MREEDDVIDEDDDDPLCPSILFTASEKTSYRQAWRSALVVRGLGRKVPYLQLAHRLNYLWARNGPLQISDLCNGCFLVRFRCREDYDLAISGGPWMLGDTYLIVHHWFKGCNPWTNQVTQAMAWIQLPDLPIELYNPEAVLRIASRIGKPVRVDRATKEGARGKYARVCVDIDLSKRLLLKYKVEGNTYLVVYEGLYKICTDCGMYRAETSLCRCKTIPESEPDSMMSDELNSGIGDPQNGTVQPSAPAFGGWMMGKKKQWKSMARPTPPMLAPK